jgi:hypothetical protein
MGEGDRETQHGETLPGRWVAAAPPGTALVLFGLRVNRWGRVLSWLPLVRALRRMIAEAGARPEASGLLWARQWRDGRVFTVLSYWRDFESAMAWAQDGRFVHRGVWRKYNRGRVGDSGDVGLWHEVVTIDPDRLHTIYRDIDRRGLAAATRDEDATEAHLRKRRELATEHAPPE